MIFKESQRFTQWWIWLIIMASDVVIVYLLIYAFVQQIIWKEPWGDEPLSDMGLSLLVIFMLFSIFLVTWVMTTAKLELVIKNDEICYRSKPFIWKWKRILPKDIHQFQVITFNRLLDYGGLGYRKTFTNGTGLIIKGNKGLVLIYGNSNRKLMIGTQKPIEIKMSMDQLMNSVHLGTHG